MEARFYIYHQKLSGDTSQTQPSTWRLRHVTSNKDSVTPTVHMKYSSSKKQVLIQK
jgi:hypothetical protein